MNSSKDMAFVIVSGINVWPYPLWDLPNWKFLLTFDFLFAVSIFFQLYLNNTKLSAFQILNNGSIRSHTVCIPDMSMCFLIFNSWKLKYDTLGFRSRINQFTRETNTDYPSHIENNAPDGYNK